MSIGTGTTSTIGMSTARAHHRVSRTRTGTGTRPWRTGTRTIPTCTTATATATCTKANSAAGDRQVRGGCCQNFGVAALGSTEAYMGTAERGEAAVAKLHFPGLGKDGAELLVARGVGAVGIDTPSIDHGQSKNFETHVALMTNNIPAFENVADISALPPSGATIVALPMKIEGGSGGPLRIVAHLPE